MNKKMITSLLLAILFVSSFPFQPTQAAPAVGYVKVTLLDVYIIDDHDGIGLGAGEIYFNIDNNGTEFSTGQVETDSGNNVTLEFVLFDSLVEDLSSMYFYVSCWDYDDLDSDDFIGEYNMTLTTFDLSWFTSTYGNEEEFAFPDTDAIFYFEVIVEDENDITLPPAVDETPYLTLTLVSAEILNKHEAIGKGNGEIYFSYQIYETRRSTTETTDVTDGETLYPDLELYKGPVFDEKFYFDIICLEADIDADDYLGGIVYNFPVFNAEWWRNNHTATDTWTIAITDVVFTVKIDVTYPAVPGNYRIYGLKNDATIYFDTSRDAQVTIRYGTSQGSLGHTLNMMGYRTSHSASITGLLANTKYYFQVETTNLDGEVYIDDNGGSLYTFETIDDLPIYDKVTKNLGIEELYYKDFTGGISFVNFTIGMFAGLYVPLIFEQKTPHYLIPGNSVSTEVGIHPEEGFAGAEVIGEVDVYGYRLQLFEPLSYYYNFLTPFGDLTLYEVTYVFPLGNLNKTEDLFSIDITAGISVTFQVGIYLEVNNTIWFSGDVDDGSPASYVIADGGDTVTHSDTVSSGATDGALIDCHTNTTLQFDNLYFRIKQMNLTVQGSIDTVVASNSDIDLNYEVIGDTGLFSPYTFPVLNDVLFPIVLKEDQLKTTSTVDAENPQYTNPSDSQVSGNTYKVQVDITDNNEIWDMAAQVEYEDTSTASVTPVHVSGDTYSFTFTIPDGESADLTISTKDIAGRVAAYVRTVDNPPDVPELSITIGIAALLIVPVALMPIKLKKNKKKNI